MLNRAHYIHRSQNSTCLNICIMHTRSVKHLRPIKSVEARMEIFYCMLRIDFHDSRFHFLLYRAIGNLVFVNEFHTRNKNEMQIECATYMTYCNNNNKNANCKSYKIHRPSPIALMHTADVKWKHFSNSNNNNAQKIVTHLMLVKCATV